MAGEWLKFDKSTPDKPEIFVIAEQLKIDPDAVVGKLIRVWSWFDTHTENGHAPSVTFVLLDRVSGVTGMAESMQSVGWLLATNDGVFLPNFDRHNGETAKSRALNNKRKAKQRKASGDVSRTKRDTSVTKTGTREEKRREEKK